MSRIVIELAGEEDVLVTRRKKEANALEKVKEWKAPEEGLIELTYDDLHETMPEAYRALFEEYFRK